MRRARGHEGRGLDLSDERHEGGSTGRLGTQGGHDR